MDNNLIINPTSYKYPSIYGKSVAALRRNEYDDIVAVRLEDGEVLEYPEIISAILRGKTVGFLMSKNESGDESFMAVADTLAHNHLNSLPSF